MSFALPGYRLAGAWSAGSMRHSGRRSPAVRLSPLAIHRDSAPRRLPSPGMPNPRHRKWGAAEQEPSRSGNCGWLAFERVLSRARLWRGPIFQWLLMKDRCRFGLATEGRRLAGHREPADALEGPASGAGVCRAARRDTALAARFAAPCYSVPGVRQALANIHEAR